MEAIKQEGGEREISTGRCEAPTAASEGKWEGVFESKILTLKAKLRHAVWGYSNRMCHF